MRCAFVCASDRLLVSVDYRQIEMRVLAQVSRDANLCSLFAQKQQSDIYSVISSFLHDKPVEATTAEDREQAKVITLGLCYGMGPETMARKLGCAVTVAAQQRNQILMVEMKR